jgi:hypothetical protein
MTDQRGNRGRGGPPNQFQTPRPAEEPPRDPGAYIGRKPERATASIPGGIGRRDVRVSAVAMRPAPVTGSTTADSPPTPEGHRQGESSTDDGVREAGQNR